MKALSPGLFSSARATWREAAVLLLSSWLVPVLIHLLPALGHRENGVYLIPAFWAAFMAVYFYGSALGVVVALVTPLINLMLTGLPAAGWVGPMSLELVAYTLTCAWLLRRWGTLWLIAPFAYIPAKAFALGVIWAVPAFHARRDVLNHLLDSTCNALPGLGVLLVINLALVLLAPREQGRDWDAH